MRTAVCDPDAFYPLRNLISGQLREVDDLLAIERFIRTVVLHDEIVMEIVPLSYDPISDEEYEWTEEDTQAGGRSVIVAFGPVLSGYDFFTDYSGPKRPAPEIKLSPALVEMARQHANAGEGNVYFESHVEYLQRVLGAVELGGSALIINTFGQQAINTARQYPEQLFSQLDKQWQNYAHHFERDGLGLLIPPVLGIVLTRCARRDAIPTIIRDLRAEWADARRQVWSRLDALRTAKTLGEAEEIRRELSEASRLFTPDRSDLDSRPVRVFWEIMAGAGAGAGIAQLSGGSPAIGAAAGALSQAARTVPPLVHDFGKALFGRGAFDLARRVRRELSKIELDALARLLSAAEKQRLGFQ